MSLRDWLAGNAMAGFTRVRDSEMYNDQTTAWYARIAYQLADAMIDERKHDRRAASQPPHMLSKPPWQLGRVAN